MGGKIMCHGVSHRPTGNQCNLMEKNKKKGMIGEFGVPYDDPKWFVVMDNFLKYMDKHHVPVKYWAAGQWWNDYNLSIEPQNGRDKPQMAIIEKYVRKNEAF